MKRRRALFLATSFVIAPAALTHAQTYYVSPTGSDNNNGTSPSSPWQSLSKVDGTTFSPGAQILFQDGGNWYGQQLNVNSSGTTSQPITYGSYGTGANPTFWGSVIVPSSSFTAVAGAPNTYFYPTTTPVNSFLVNHQFTHDAPLITLQTTDSANISYVESNANSSYYQADGTTPGLYVNFGAPINSSNVLTAAIHDDVVLSFNQSNIIIKNLTVEESAKSDEGYGIRVENSTNVQVQNSTVIAAGKHAIGVIDSTGFVGTGLNASYLMPDQGYGGATAYVSYSDSNVSNTTSQWINDTFTNANGPYQAFITHADSSASDPTPIASVLVQNLVTNSSPAVTIYTAGNEHVSIIGGQVTNGDVQLAGNNTTVQGMTLTGANGVIEVGGGTGNVIQNNIINGATPNWQAGHDGAIVDSGQGTVIRFNTIVMGQAAATVGAAIGLESNTTGTQIYGNIIDTPYAAFFQHTPGTPQINAFDNLYAGTSNPQIIFYFNQSPDTPVTSLPSTINASALYGDPGFVNQAGGDLSLQPNSIAAYVFNPTTGQYVMNDIYNNVRPTVLASLGAIQETAVSLTWTNASNNGVWDVNTSANWNDGSGAAKFTNQNTVLFDDANSGHYSVTLNSTVSPGRIVISNSQGNYSVSGSGHIAGSGSLMKFGSGVFTLSTSNTYSGGTTVNAGTLIAGVHGALPNGSVSITGGTLQLATGTGLAQMTSLSIAGNGTLDINNNHVIITYSSGSDPISSIAAWITSGYAGGTWTGTGIKSTMAQSNSKSYGVGYADAADPGNPAGLVSGQIEIKYTLLGDANLDGKVNGTDFAILATQLNQAATSWDQGDFNYDKKINGSDFAFVTLNLGLGASQAATDSGDQSVNSLAAASAFSANVPEPTFAGVLILVGAVTSHRRRRR